MFFSFFMSTKITFSVIYWFTYDLVAVQVLKSFSELRYMKSEIGPLHSSFIFHSVYKIQNITNCRSIFWEWKSPFIKMLKYQAFITTLRLIKYGWLASKCLFYHKFRLTRGVFFNFYWITDNQQFNISKKFTGLL